jgi:WS/DGAT/MGAT family acyltransferase
MAPDTKLTRRMSAEDAAFLYFETNTAPLHIGSLGIFEGDISLERLKASMASRMHLIPRYRQRAVIPPLYAGHPTWEDDPDFSLDRHLREVQLPAPGTREQLLQMSADIFGAGILPRDRPLWDMTLIKGLEDGRTGFHSRVHHCLVDGVSGVELLLAVMDLVPNPEPTPPPAEPWVPTQIPSPFDLWRDAAVDQLNKNVQAFTEWQRTWLDPRAQMRALNEFQRAVQTAIPQLVRPRPALPWNHVVTAKRGLAVATLSFQEVRGIRATLGGTVNDIMLTLLGGAIGRYLRGRGEKTENLDVRFFIPVNVRQESEQGALGNRVSGMMPEIPAGIVDPAERLAEVRARMGKLKDADQAGAFHRMVEFAENLPPILAVIAGFQGVPPGGPNLICTNVPGPMIPLFSVGHRMHEFYPLFPLSADQGIGVAISSYDKSLYVGLMYDPDSVPDAGEITRHLDEEFRLLKTQAGVKDSDLPDFNAATPAKNGMHANGAKETAPEETPATVSAGSP